jgi:hypothetical protein
MFANMYTFPTDFNFFSLLPGFYLGSFSSAQLNFH